MKNTEKGKRVKPTGEKSWKSAFVAIVNICEEYLSEEGLNE